MTKKDEARALVVETKKRFERDLKRCARKSGTDLGLAKQAIAKLANRQALEARHRDHALLGDYADCRECHVRPDLLLIYQVSGDTLRLIRLGSHSDLF